LFLSPAIQIGGGEVIRCGGSISRVVQILGTTPSIEQERSASKGDGENGRESERDVDIEGSIAFENVSFAYPTRKHVPALRNVSFSVPAGTSIALVGRSGGGKSTVVQLLQRFFEPSEGSVRIDGRPLNSYDLSYLRRHLVGVVPQDPVVFTGTIADNISFGKPEGATESEILVAARDAGVLEFSSRLPKGLDTVVGPSSGGLSGGEKQRVMIARCLLKNPPVLLLDEATSALDATSEAMVNTTIERLMADRRRTVVVVTHRMSIAQRCDRVVVLDRGTVCEEGPHADLAKNPNSMYSQLLRTRPSPSDHLTSRL
jgi:ABC-type multidrug transport system fused ATPase/permease subunit